MIVVEYLVDMEGLLTFLGFKVFLCIFTTKGMSGGSWPYLSLVQWARSCSLPKHPGRASAHGYAYYSSVRNLFSLTL